jgi:alpha-beta hydrolase superfamily lysophospholipase
MPRSADTFTFRDRDDVAVFVRHWTPEAGPAKAVVQVVHGMQEHGGRYEHLAGALIGAGYAVYAGDLRGHGLTAVAPHELGHLGPGGWEAALSGVGVLGEIAREENPGAGLFLLGHSFGSFLVQAFVQRWGDRLRGAVLSGTNGRNPLLRAGLVAARLIARRQGLDATATTLRQLAMGSFNKRFARGPGVTGMEWLSRDPAATRAYIDDPLCGFDLPNSFFLELFDLLDATWRPERERRIPRRLPIYMFSGSEDPVGGRTRGVEALARRYRRVGLADVTVRFYPGGRHEMLNELNRDEVAADLVTWLDARV